MATCAQESLDLSTYTQIKRFRDRMYAYIWFGNDDVPSVIHYGGFPPNFFDGIEIHHTSGVGQDNWAAWAAYVTDSSDEQLETDAPDTIQQSESRLLSHWANNASNFRQWTIVQIVSLVSPISRHHASDGAPDEPDEPGEYDGEADEPTIFGSKIPEEDPEDDPVIPTVHCRLVDETYCDEERDRSTTETGIVLEVPAVFLYCISPTRVQVAECIDAHKERIYQISRRRVLNDHCFDDEDCARHTNALDCMVHTMGPNPDCMWCIPNKKCYAFNSNSYLGYCGGVDCTTFTTREDCNQNGGDRCWWDSNGEVCRYGREPEQSCSTFSMEEDCVRNIERCKWDNDGGACISRPDTKPCGIEKNCIESIVQHCPPQWWLNQNFEDANETMSCLACVGKHQSMLRRGSCSPIDVARYCESGENSCVSEEQINQQRSNNMYCNIYHTKDGCLLDRDKQCCWLDPTHDSGDYLCVDSTHYGGRTSGICNNRIHDGL